MNSGRKLGSEASVVVASRIVIAVAQIGTALALVRLLPKDQFGVLRFLLLLYQTVSGVAIFGFPQGLLYFLPQLDPARRKAFVRLTTLILATLGLLGGGVLFLLRGPLTGSFEGDARQLVPLMALYIVLDLPTLALPNLLIGLGRAPLAARLNIVSALVMTAGLLIPVACQLPLLQVLAIFTGSAALRLGLYLGVAAWVHAGVRAGPLREHFRPLLRFSLPLGLSSTAGLLNQQIDKYLIGLSFAASVYAEYAVGAEELPLVSVLPYTVATVLMPTLVSHWQAAQKSEFLKVWHTSIIKVALIMLPVCVLLFVAAEAYITLLFTSNYLRATGPMRVYLLLLPLRVTSYGVVLQSLGDTRTVMEVSIAGVLLNAVCSAGAIATIGFLGPSIAAVAVQFVLVVLLLLRIRRHLGVRVREVFPWGAYLNVVLVSLVAAPLALVVHWLLRGNAGLALGVSALAYFAGYVVVGSWTGVISAADRNWVLRRLRLLRQDEAA
jgi:O-antigen/teichoic acid export membrane protein